MAQIEDDVVAGGMLWVHVARDVVGQPVHRLDHAGGAGERIGRPNAQ